MFGPNRTQDAERAIEAHVLGAAVTLRLETELPLAHVLSQTVAVAMRKLSEIDALSASELGDALMMLTWPEATVAERLDAQGVVTAARERLAAAERILCDAAAERHAFPDNVVPIAPFGRGTMGGVWIAEQIANAERGPSEDAS
ncbi:hypothetical protein LX81_00254 [Palleronia aestuarii]|uniref:Uncharacterized protein n=1 Tax=Palleronia aestuarii TaxID=568105 RepID=A0A2W7P8U5_9RHOB|nr:hypothetical protein [Palleronia aestuarii]PZX19792.1 hypothetical protein LX81_00254 [Palleronia aestuarii]